MRMRRRISVGVGVGQGERCVVACLVPSDSSRVMGEDAHLVWSGSSGAGLVWALQAAGCWLALSLLALQSAVGDLRVRLEQRRTGCSSGRLTKTVRCAGGGQAPGDDTGYWLLWPWRGANLQLLDR